MVELCACLPKRETPIGGAPLLVGGWFPLDVPIDTWTQLSREDDRALRAYLRQTRKLVAQACGASAWNLEAASIWLTAQHTLERFRRAVAEGAA